MDVINKHQIPAQGIMQISEFDNAKSFLIACECTDPTHQVDAWIEVNKELDVKQVSVTFFVKTYIPFIDGILTRVKAAWNILITGSYEQQHNLLLSKQVALNFAHTIIDTVSEMENKS